MNAMSDCWATSMSAGGLLFTRPKVKAVQPELRGKKGLRGRVSLLGVVEGYLGLSYCFGRQYRPTLCMYASERN